MRYIIYKLDRFVYSFRCMFVSELNGIITILILYIMATIQKPNNINEVKAYFLACGYFYRETKNSIETSIDRKHGVYVVSQYNVQTSESIQSHYSDTLSEAKANFKRINI